MIKQLHKKMTYSIFPIFAIMFLPVLLYSLIYYTSPKKILDFTQTLVGIQIISGFAVYAYITQYPYTNNINTKGPEQVDGTIPDYNKFGFSYYILTVSIQLILTSIYGNGVFLHLMDNHLLSLILLSTLGFVFTIYLLIQGKQKHSELSKKDKLHKSLQEPEGSTLIYQYYRGMQFHPKFLNVDVKQLTNCRFGMMIWQVLVLGWALASTERFGLNNAVLVTTVLQTLYIAKFFYWEIGYFYTLDMTLDRAGYYICWGCIVFVPCFYTLASFVITSNPPQISNFEGIFFVLVGVASLWLNYWVDYQKQYFQKCKQSGKKCLLWGKEVKTMDVQYTTPSGKVVNSKLMLSGFWGVSRHLNYTFELLLAFCWCYVGFKTSIASLSYFAFLTILLVSRAYRDEEKCSKKYGKYWEQYCQQVKYRLIPYLY